ncbi:MAG: cyclic nucleotide-binding domain-containing protein [Prochlorococcaceae cyanobacterium]
MHSRLLATFLAINGFFWFADPLLGVLGSQGGQLLRSLVLVATSIALFRSWPRDQATYRRESVSGSLRRQLGELSGLEAALDGRSLEALSPQEVFTLVKALPTLGQARSRSLYRNVMADMLRSGRLDCTSSLLQLQDVRQTLQLEEADHHQVVRLLARDEPQLLELDHLHRQMDELRREAAAASIDRLLKLAGQPLLVPERLPPSLAGQLEELQRRSGLDEQSWADLLHGFGPRGEVELRRLEGWRADWRREAGSLARLAELAVSDPLLRPLRQAMLQRSEAARVELDQRLQAAGLAPLPAAVPASGGLDQALDLLWHDPDPDTAGWVLMLARERNPERLARCLQDPRSGLGDSPFLQGQRRGETHPDRHEFPAIAAAALFADLLPEGVLWVARQGRLLPLQPGEALLERGAASDSLALVVDGEVLVWAGGDQPIRLGLGQTVGEIGVITGAPRSAGVTAASQGALLFVLPDQAFEALLERSRSFGRGLLAQLARRLAAGSPGPWSG